MGINMAKRDEGTGLSLEKTVTVNRPIAEVYQFWRNFQNLPGFMQHLATVQPDGPGRTHWVAQAPGGITFEWDAEMVEARENEVIAWRSLPGSDVDTAGSVHFKPLSHGRGTAVAVSLKYNPPAGKVGALVASLLGQGLEGKITEDLRNFKRYMETGELPSIKDQPSGRERPGADEPRRPVASHVAVPSAYEEPT